MDVYYVQCELHAESVTTADRKGTFDAAMRALSRDRYDADQSLMSHIARDDIIGKDDETSKSLGSFIYWMHGGLGTKRTEADPLR